MVNLGQQVENTKTLVIAEHQKKYQNVLITNKNKLKRRKKMTRYNALISYLLIEDRDGDIIIPDSVWTTKKQ